jgi:hypothetical protein
MAAPVAVAVARLTVLLEMVVLAVVAEAEVRLRGAVQVCLGEKAGQAVLSLRVTGG